MKVKLRVMQGAKMGDTELALPVTIGRGRDAQMTLALPLVSRLHCEIYTEAEQIFVRDLGSTNGTSVGGRVIEGPTAVQHGELLTIGSTTFQLLSEDCDPPAPVPTQAAEPTGLPEPEPFLPEPVAFDPVPTDPTERAPSPADAFPPAQPLPVQPLPAQPLPVQGGPAAPLAPSQTAPTETAPAAPAPTSLPTALPMAKPIAPTAGTPQPPTPIDLSRPPAEPPVDSTNSNGDEELGDFFKRHK